jgi:hypothetical protein
MGIVLLSHTHTLPIAILSADLYVMTDEDMLMHMRQATRVYLGRRFSHEEVMAFGGIPDAFMNVCSSERIRAQPMLMIHNCRMLNISP